MVDGHYSDPGNGKGLTCRVQIPSGRIYVHFILLSEWTAISLYEIRLAITLLHLVAYNEYNLERMW